MMLSRSRDFKTFFDVSDIRSHMGPDAKQPFPDYDNWIQPFLCFSGGKFKAKWINPTHYLIHLVEDSMIRFEGDRIYFEIVMQSCGNLALFAKYNQILGSRHIANIDPDTIPGV